MLGHTLAEIAREKAGILKPGVPAVGGRQPPEAARVIAARARRPGAPLLRPGAEGQAGGRGPGLLCGGPGRGPDSPSGGGSGWPHPGSCTSGSAGCVRSVPSPVTASSRTLACTEPSEASAT